MFLWSSIKSHPPKTNKSSNNMATPKKIKGASFGEECMDFMKNCEGKKNGTNDNFVRNFNIFGVERNGKSNVIDRLEHLSVINHGEKNAAEHVCDQLLKDKSSLFYSKTKIEERMGVWEDGKQKYSKKTSRQEAIGFAHFFSDCLEDKNINDLLELSMNELLNVAIPCLKATNHYKPLLAGTPGLRVVLPQAGKSFPRSCSHIPCLEAQKA